MDYFPSSCFKYYFLLIYIETSSEDNPLAIAITRLLALEQAIERRYLKHPLRNEWVNATLFHPVISKTFVTASQIGHYWTETSLKWRSMQENIIKKRLMSVALTHCIIRYLLGGGTAYHIWWPCPSCKLLPVQYQEYKNGLIFSWSLENLWSKWTEFKGWMYCLTCLMQWMCIFFPASYTFLQILVQQLPQGRYLQVSLFLPTMLFNMGLVW